MVDTLTKSSSLKAAFAREKENRVDKVMEEAQRLVNLYHHSDEFGNEFSAQLDDMLLTSSPEVQAAIQNILGGSDTQKYIDFLKNKKSEVNTDNTDPNAEASATAQTGYLPSPAEDEPMPMTTSLSAPDGNGVNMAVIEALFKNFACTHQTELEHLLQAQTETLSQVMQRLDKNTHEVANHQTNRLINAIKQEAEKQGEYSDVIDETSSQTPVLVPDEMEGF